MSVTFAFTIPGHPRGYYAQAAHSRWKMSKEQRARATKYREWQKEVAVRYLAARNDGLSGLAIPPLPLEARQDTPVWIETRSWFKDGRHPDPENVHKGIVDALFRWSLSGDRHVGGTFQSPLYDRENPRVEVVIRWGR